MTTAQRAACSAVLFLFLGSISYAAEKNRCEVHAEADPVLCAYEPNTIGYTKDSDDSGFMDFKLSLRYQLFPDWITKLQNHFYDGLGNRSALYLAFTGRFGQYFSRDSSPVIEKRFNPKIFYRYRTEDAHDDQVDVAFAHESNGQSIDSPAEYQAARASSKNPDDANDQLSRGWDYWEVVWKRSLWKGGPLENNHAKNDHVENELIKTDAQAEYKTTVTSYLTLKYFLPHGPLEGRAEDYNAWENNPQGKQRSHVNGIAGMLKLVEKGDLWNVFKDMKVAALYETGYREPVRYNTVRFELGTKVLQLPMTVWFQSGYNSDLAQYYKKVDSYGIEAEIGSF